MKKSTDKFCNSCGAQELYTFYELKSVPVHSVLLMPTHEGAVNYPKGDIQLGFCKCCGFISNLAFDPSKHEYSPRYEETQGFSPKFNDFHSRLAIDLIDRHDLRKKNILEIGCGKGEFITLLCELGENRGIGFDPAHDNERNNSQAKNRIKFINDFYSEKYWSYKADFVCCKMTLEHINNTFQFVSSVRRSIGDRPNTIIFFQVPNAARILRELAFWDIYYEHCSYFSLGSLARLFLSCDFEILNLSMGYEDQYLMIEARPGRSEGKKSPLPVADDLEELAQGVEYFSKHYKKKLNTWKRKIEQAREKGQRNVIWGGGSKCVAFLTTLNIKDEIEYVVDLNPYKHGTYIAGTGQKIVDPNFLQDYKPDIVLVMNPIYYDEIKQKITTMGLLPEINSV